MSKKVAIFWPGDYRAKPNEWALPQSRETTEQLVAALKKLGRSPYVVEGYLTRPDQAITKLGPIDDPMIGVFVHWTYAPHTVDGVVGKDNPCSWPRIFRAPGRAWSPCSNTGASLESVGRAASRVWTDAPDWTADAPFMDRLDEWCSTGRIVYAHERAPRRRRDRPESSPLAAGVPKTIRQPARARPDARRHLDGHDQRLLRPPAALPDRVHRAQGRPGLAHRSGQSGQRPARRRRLPVRPGQGVTFHWKEADAEDFTAEATREQLRGYLAVLDLLDEFKADCLGWQYQLGLLKLLPPSDFAEGLLNSHARPEGNGHAVITSTEADQGNLVPMELMKRLLEAKGLPGAVMFHDVRWGARARRPVPLGAAELGELRRLRVQPRREQPGRESTASVSRPATSPSPAARSPASACRARSPGPELDRPHGRNS